MIIRKSRAVWRGDIKAGKGEMQIGSGNVKLGYSFLSRFGDERGTNPEELLGAAHAGCFSMALSLILSTKGFKPESIETTAQVGVDKEGDGFKIKTIRLTTEAKIPGISEDDFRKYALQAKNGCPVSMALASVPRIELEAKLLEAQASTA